MIVYQIHHVMKIILLPIRLRVTLNLRCPVMIKDRLLTLSWWCAEEEWWFSINLPPINQILITCRFLNLCSVPPHSTHVHNRVQRAKCNYPSFRAERVKLWSCAMNVRLLCFNHCWSTRRTGLVARMHFLFVPASREGGDKASPPNMGDVLRIHYKIIIIVILLPVMWFLCNRSPRASHA